MQDHLAPAIGQGCRSDTAEQKMARSRGSFGRITLADVARSAGVATMTVSRYLNQHPNVTAKTARTVKAIDKLGYFPNHAARILMGQPSNVIGLIVPDLTDEFFATVAHHVQEVAAAQNYLVWIAASNFSGEADLNLIQRMIQHHVDGILIIPSPGAKLAGIESQKKPIIALDRPIPNTRIDTVTLENRNDAYKAMQHFLTHGYRKVACFGPELNLHTVHERFAGYQDAMREHRYPVLPYAHCFDTASTVRALKRHLSKRSRPMRSLL